KKYKNIFLKNETNETLYYLTSRAFKYFLDNNNGGANILQIKFSTIAPFLPGNYSIGDSPDDYNIVDGNLVLIVDDEWLGWNGTKVVCTDKNHFFALLNVRYQACTPLKSIRYNLGSI